MQNNLLKFPFIKGAIVSLIMFCCLLFSQSLSAQNVTGRVLSDQGETLIGVNVVVKGTTTGVSTDVNGNFSIPAEPWQVLVFSLLGYNTREVTIRRQNEVLRIEMQESNFEIEELVVIAYGNAKKRDLTGAVSSVKASEILRTNPLGINQGLQGKVAGVIVNQADGAPGAGINIQIRGANSFTTSTEPLYVVDGIPFNIGEAPQTDYGMKQTNNPLNSINPKDIESIEILKDASATAIYGSRAANGVVLITTRRGTEGRAKVDFSATFGMSKVVKKIDVLNAATYAEYRNELDINGYTYDGKNYVAPENLPFPTPGRWTFPTDGSKPNYSPSPKDFREGYLGGGTNWQDQIFQTAWSKDYNLTVSGGDAKGQYLFSGGMLDQQGVIVNSFFKRYSFRSNINRQIRNWFTIDNSLNLTKSDNRFARTNTENYGVINDAISFYPTRTVFDPDEASGLSEDYSSGLSNPYGYVRNAKNLVGTLTLSESLGATVKFTDFLSFRQRVGYWYSNQTRNVYYNRYVSAGISTRGQAQQADSYYSSLTTESMLLFNKNFTEMHKIDAVVAWSYENVNWGSKALLAKGFPNDINEEYDMGSAELQEKYSTSRGESSLMSYLGRANYTLMDRYLLTASFRRDGSSRLSPINGRWNNFYSMAVAWRLSDEDFIKDLGLFNILKIRYSYGMTGNQGIGAYATRSRMTSQQYVTDGSIISGYAEDRWGGPAAPNLKWETTYQSNLGLDVSVLNNRINLVIDLYQKETKDLLQYMFIPPSTGFSSIATNYGTVKNKGLEITGNFFLIDKNDFTWKMDANISFNRNKIGGLEADQFSDVAWGIESVFLRRNGLPIGTLYAYQEDGFFNNEAEVRANPVYMNESDAKIRSMIGQVKYKDTNDDGVIDARDKVIIGCTQPDFIYGITNTFTYKNWSLSFFLQGIKGNDILNVNLNPYDLSGTRNLPRFVYDNRWTESNKKNAQFPRPDNTYTRSLRASDRLVEDGSYLRMKNVSVGYRLVSPIREIDVINITFGINNLFTITNYKWYDPDVNSFGSDASRRGVDMNSYPSARTFNLGIQVTF